jgi:hypothetical protein
MNTKTKLVNDLVKNKAEGKIHLLEGIKSAQVNALMATIKQAIGSGTATIVIVK